MRYIRILRHQHWEKEKGRFDYRSFKKLGDGISVIDKECVEQKGGDICKHIAAHYRTVTSDPIIFWDIDQEILSAHQIKNSPSATDDCHCDIVEISNEAAKKMFYGYQRENGINAFSICDKLRGSRSLTLDDTANLGSL
jgi:hypothetical protein